MAIFDLVNKDEAFDFQFRRIKRLFAGFLYTYTGFTIAEAYAQRPFDSIQ
jgi:hypothetical protein